MSAPRFIGQDCEFSVLVDQQAVLNVIAIASAEWTYKIALKEQGYLGETFDRVDEVYKGISGSIEFHASSPEVFNLIDVIVQRAQRRRPPRPMINMKCRISFPNDGRSALVVIPNMSFGEIPVRVANREEYGSFTLPFGAEQAKAVVIG